MTALKLILVLSSLVLKLLETFRENKLITEAEARGAARAMELVHARLQKGIDARRAAESDPSAGSVRDSDPYLRD